MKHKKGVLYKHALNYKIYNEIIKVYDLFKMNPIILNRVNILQATFKAMNKAILNLNQKPDKSLIDGYGLPNQIIKNEGVIGGDDLIECISAASIIAKVTRDRIMLNIDKVFPEYGFAKHKGYGTKIHMESLKINKASPIHRKSFKPVKENVPTTEWLKNNNKFNQLAIQLVCLDYLNHVFKININFNIDIYNIKVIKDDLLVFIKVLVKKENNNIPNLSEDNIYKLKNEVLKYKKEVDKVIKSKFEIASITLKKNPLIQVFDINI